MKKAFSLLFVFLLMFSLFACIVQAKKDKNDTSYFAANGIKTTEKTKRYTGETFVIQGEDIEKNTTVDYQIIYKQDNSYENQITNNTQVIQYEVIWDFVRDKKRGIDNPASKVLMGFYDYHTGQALMVDDQEHTYQIQVGDETLTATYKITYGKWRWKPWIKDKSECRFFVTIECSLPENFPGIVIAYYSPKTVERFYWFDSAERIESEDGRKDGKFVRVLFDKNAYSHILEKADTDEINIGGQETVKEQKDTLFTPILKKLEASFVDFAGFSDLLEGLGWPKAIYNNVPAFMAKIALLYLVSNGIIFGIQLLTSVFKRFSGIENKNAGSTLFVVGIQIVMGTASIIGSLFAIWAGQYAIAATRMCWECITEWELTFFNIFLIVVIGVLALILYAIALSAIFATLGMGTWALWSFRGPLAIMDAINSIFVGFLTLATLWGLFWYFERPIGVVMGAVGWYYIIQVFFWFVGEFFSALQIIGELLVRLFF